MKKINIQKLLQTATQQQQQQQQATAQLAADNKGQRRSQWKGVVLCVLRVEQAAAASELVE